MAQQSLQTPPQRHHCPIRPSPHPPPIKLRFTDVDAKLLRPFQLRPQMRAVD
jgi:hypothetical protein